MMRMCFWKVTYRNGDFEWYEEAMNFREDVLGRSCRFEICTSEASLVDEPMVIPQTLN